MIWRSRCSHIRNLLALRAGSDLDAAGEGEVQQHLGRCESCRAHWERVQAGQRVLEQVGRPAALPEGESVSLWPALRLQLLEARLEEPQAQPVHAWVPLSAVAVACLAVMIAFQKSPPVPFEGPGMAAHGSRSSSPQPVRFSGPQETPEFTQERDAHPLRPREERLPLSERLKVAPQGWKLSPVGGEPADF